MVLSELSYARSRSTLWPLAMLVAMALLMSGGPAVHAESVLLSSLIASPDATISGPGGLIYSHFAYDLPSFVSPPSNIVVTTDSLSSTQSRIQFGSFTAPAFLAFTYQVTSTIAPITDFHLVTPAGVSIGPGRAFVDSGILVSVDVAGVGSTFNATSQGGCCGSDHTLMNVLGGATPFPQVLPVIFPGGLATLTIRNGIQMSAPDSTIGPFPTNASLTLPYFANVYTVTIVPEPSTWLLLASGLIVLMMSKLRALNLQRCLLTALAWMILGGAAIYAGHEQEARDADLFGQKLNGQPLLGQQHKDAYGPGVHSDATGRPFSWQAEGETQPNPILEVKPNAYGPGVGSDQFGRPVRPACPPGMRLC